MTKTQTSPVAPVAPVAPAAPAAPAPASTPPAPGTHATPASASAENALALPHDRDQAVNMTNEQPNPVIEQATQDVKDGLKDTSKAPEMHNTYQKQR